MKVELDICPSLVKSGGGGGRTSKFLPSPLFGQNKCSDVAILLKICG